LHIDENQILPLSPEDEELFYSFIKPNESNTNFEDSYEYIRLYFNSGEWSGYRFDNGKTFVFFAKAGDTEKPATLRYKIGKPLGAEPVAALEALVEVLKSRTGNQIQVVCLPKDIANELKGVKKKQFRYFIYDLDELGELSGQKWKNVRQKLTKFEKDNRSVRVEELDSDNSENVVHLISSWRKEALMIRGFSYTQVEKAKFAARYYADKIDNKNIWAYVYIVGGKTAGFELLYRIGRDAAANPIGFTELAIDGLAEYAQVHAWQEVAKSGIRYVNDGPSWRRSLEAYKRKFNPITEQLVIECYL
jgi:hypothetical protein